MDAKSWPKTLQEAVVYFADPDNALNFLVKMRWPNGVTCQVCGSRDVSFLATRRLWKCKNAHAKRQFSIKKNSIFEDSPLGLDKWLVAMWLIINCKNGISSYEVGRALHVTQQTGWFMLHRIRKAMQRGGMFFFDARFGGEVEVDETYIGGKARNMHADKRRKKITGTGGSGKIAVMGLLERHAKKGHSQVRTAVVSNVKRPTLHEQIKENVEPGSTIYSDALRSYEQLPSDYVHKVIDHAECYVKGAVHTNGMENFWSCLKRSIKGTYVSVEPFHLFRYLDEQAFRFNERKNEDGDGGRFVEAFSNVFGNRLTYKELIGETPTLPTT